MVNFSRALIALFLAKVYPILGAEILYPQSTGQCYVSVYDRLYFICYVSCSFSPRSMERIMVYRRQPRDYLFFCTLHYTKLNVLHYQLLGFDVMVIFCLAGIVI